MSDPWTGGRDGTCGRCRARIPEEEDLCAGCELRGELRATLDWGGCRREWRERIQSALDRYDDRCARGSWTRVWSHDDEQYYYWQRPTGLTQWENPWAGARDVERHAGLTTGIVTTTESTPRPDAPQDLGGGLETRYGAGASQGPPPAMLLRGPLQMTPARIGIDVGGVLKRYGDAPWSPWEYRRDAEVPGAMEALRRCIQHFGAANVFTLSKCRGEMRRKTEIWLTETMKVCDPSIGMRLENILYSQTRSGPQGKGEVAERLRLRLSHFVDDKDDCLRSVYEEGRSQEQVEQHRGQFFHMARGGEGWRSPWPKDWPREQRPACVIPVRNWNDVLWHLGLYGEAGTDVPETNLAWSRQSCRR